MIPFQPKQLPFDPDELLQEESRKTDLIRILIQALENLGYEQSAQVLIEESGINLENESLQKFRQAILLGQWQKSIDMLNNLELSQEQFNQACFLIYEHKYLELIETRNFQEAITMLRNNITQFCKDQTKLHQLASFIMCKNMNELQEKASWSGANLNSRKKLLGKIQNQCRPFNMLKSNIIGKLINQAIQYQIISCQYHETLPEDYSLINDHQCQSQNFPEVCIQNLKGHNDEVWIVKFSNSGNRFASIAKNKSLCIWNFNQQTKIANLQQKIEKIHEKDVQCMCWSSTDIKILTGSADHTIKIWYSQTGNLLQTLKEHQEIICAVLWHPNKPLFFSGGIDNFIVIWNDQGQKQEAIKSTRISDILISQTQNNLLYGVSASHYKIIIYDIEKKQEINYIEEKDVIVSAAISSNGKFLLINTSYKNPELHLWKLNSLQLVNIYQGHVQEKFMLRCSFGGVNDQIVACGSENSKIYLWHRNQKDPKKILNGHTQTVNSLSWHPIDPQILISGSDDHKIKIWITQEECNHLKYEKIEDEGYDSDLQKIEKNSDNLCDQCLEEMDQENEIEDDEDIEEEEIE